MGHGFVETAGARPGDRTFLQREPSKGEGLSQNVRPAAVYPRRHPIGVDSVVDHSAPASESRHLAPSVEQEIYLKDTPVAAR